MSNVDESDSGFHESADDSAHSSAGVDRTTSKTHIVDSSRSSATTNPADVTGGGKGQDGSDQSLSQLALMPGHAVEGRYEIQQRLGRGGFGAVFRAHDRDLNRVVAIKQSTGLRSFVAGQIRNEAQSVASLSHPNIVAIHDLITVSPHELLIVMECLEGDTLGKRLRRSRLAIVDAVKIAIQIADALQHAHERMLVHSDLKPGNLFLCKNGLVKLLDFGLAVAYFPDETSGQVGGTPGYMSPEQIRGESHRIDGRVDIFSFGVVLYEMLTGAKPFVGASVRAVCDATLRKEVPPPRQLNPGIDEELQRVTLRCLEKRMIDRYHSASALREDLKHWLDVNASTATDLLAGTAVQSDTNSKSSSHSLRLGTRGLQPYTELDAETYLPLIPGPRDRNGIPDSIAFWKRWVESDDASTDYAVGVLYGPSGSGKTSYVRAGLLNQLDRDICRVYIECRPGDLGGRLTRIIQSQLREESTGSSLRDLLTRLRSDDSSSHDFRKMLIVLDQFESWSHTATLEERQDFADALRQCDGIQIRALVVTRDDFWMGVKELLRWLELPLQEGRNVASVDLMDSQHAMRLLEAMGRETGTLPQEGQSLSTGQQQFIRQAVDELTSNGIVICVHLVMFAQMVRLQKWTPRGLRSGGGVAGACSLFFQELFQKSGSRSPEYRFVSDAVPPILSELVPPIDSTVAAISVSREQLTSAVRAAGCAPLLDDCLRVLTEDLRIVTAITTDPVGFGSQADRDDSEAPDDGNQDEARYRLSHDFLVRPINVFLDRARSRTWRGRTKFRLAELSDAWSRRPVRAHLPEFREFLSLLAGSRFQSRSEPESQYLKAAARLHANRISVGVIALIAFMLMTVITWRQWSAANEAREGALASNVALLLDGPASNVTLRITELQEFGRDAATQIEPWTRLDDPKRKLRAELYMQSLSPDSIAGIVPLIEVAPPELFDPILETAKQAADAKAELTAIVETSPSFEAVIRAAILLAYLDDFSAVESLLAGCDNADRDQTVLLAASKWRGEPAPWAELLARHPDPQVRYHAAIILGTYNKSELQQARVEIDLVGLINSRHASVHSAGRFLAKHMGQDVYAVPLQPPADADWRVGPDNIPMLRFAAGSIEYHPNPNSPDAKQEVKVENDFWFATIPVSRRLFNEFAASGGPLADGSELKKAIVSMSITDAQKNDDREPVFGINLGQAYSFCNWLSEREGLTPCYRYAEVKPPARPSADYVPPPIPWETIQSSMGYRVPTQQQYRFAIRCRYVKGIPWKHVTTLAVVGGDYSPPVGSEYVRPLFSLTPNRLGLFVNDRKCGTWICGRTIASGLNLGNSSTLPQFLRDRTSFLHSIFLVQESSPNVDARAQLDVDANVLKLRSFHNPKR